MSKQQAQIQRKRPAPKVTPAAPPVVNAETWRKILRHYPEDEES